MEGNKEKIEKLKKEKEAKEVEELTLKPKTTLYNEHENDTGENRNIELYNRTLQ